MEENKIKVWKEEFAIAKSKKINSGAFANIMDEKEITVIIDQAKINDEEFIKIDRDCKLITIDIVFGFNVVGVIAKISGALAKENISIMPIVAYSRDHILIKKDNLDKTIEILKGVELK